MMRRLLPALCAWLCIAGAAAQQPSQLEAPERNGYAFEYPLILAQQRLFGIAHGIDLLATACRALPPETAAAAEAAYALWRVREEAAIAAARRDLGEYYFGDPEATWQAVSRKLVLKDALDVAPNDLQPACASLPEALQQPRYALAERFRLEELMARVVAATEIEARERACRPLFSDEALTLHEARYAVWQEINQPLLDEAKKALAQAWPGDAPAVSFDEWYAELGRKTQAGGTPSRCVAFSESLKRPEMALRNVFRRPPPLQSPALPQ
jgi:hypothetical protein